MISVIIPAYHEQRTINQTLSHLLRVTAGTPCEIIVVDASPEAATLNAIADFPVVRLVSPAGRARQMNAGAAVARGDILLFLHADTLLPQRACVLMSSALDETGAGAGSFLLGMRESHPFLRFIVWTANLRTRLLRTPYGDQALFFKTSYFRQLGGFADLPLMEDVEIMRRIRRRREAIAVVPVPVVTSSRRWRQEGLWRAFMRNKSIQLLYTLGVPPAAFQRWYRPHQESEYA